MGLMIVQARFDNAPPRADEVQEVLSRLIGSARAIHSVEVEGTVVSITFAPSLVTRAYVLKLVDDLGGIPINAVTGQAYTPNHPPFVRLSWRRWPLWKRAYFRLTFNGSGGDR